MPTKIPITQTTAALLSHAKTLEETAGQLRAVVQSMVDDQIEAIAVTNDDQMNRARIYVNNFAAAARLGLDAARKERDAVGAKAKQAKGKPALRVKKSDD